MTLRHGILQWASTLSQVSILHRTLLVWVGEEKKRNHLDVVLTATSFILSRPLPSPYTAGSPRVRGMT